MVVNKLADELDHSSAARDDFCFKLEEKKALKGNTLQRIEDLESSVKAREAAVAQGD